MAVEATETHVTKNRTKARPVIPIPNKINSSMTAPMRLAIIVATAYARKPIIGKPPRTRKVDRATNFSGFCVANCDTLPASVSILAPRASPDLDVKKSGRRASCKKWKLCTHGELVAGEVIPNLVHVLVPIGDQSCMCRVTSQL